MYFCVQGSENKGVILVDDNSDIIEIHSDDGKEDLPNLSDEDEHTPMKKHKHRKSTDEVIFYPIFLWVFFQQYMMTF